MHLQCNNKYYYFYRSRAKDGKRDKVIVQTD